MQKNLIYILLLISLFSLTFGCQTESYDFGREDGSIEVLEDGRLRVPILLHIPEREVVETKSAPSDAEKVVKTVDICVFDASGNRLEKVSGVIDPSNSLRVFATVLPRNVACKVQVYVNIPARCRVAFNAADNKAIIDTLTMSNVIFNNDSITKNGLPMVSTLDSYTALNSTTLKGKVANLKFAYARIDVDVSSAADFNLVSCQKLNFRQISYLTEQTPLAYPNSIIEKIAVNQLSGIYLFESPGTNPTDLIIKGTKTGFGEGFYKIRIAYGTDKTTYDIRRGVRYAVTITSVKGPGYASAEEAIANEPSNVECDIKVDDGSSKDVIISNGSYYLGVSNSEYIIYADDARGVIPVTITHNAPSTVTNAKITLSGAGMSFSSPLQSELLFGQGDNKNEAFINSRDGAVHTIPLRIDFAANDLTAGSITIRIGDLVKTIRVVRNGYLSETGTHNISLTDCSVVESQSPRIVVNSNTSLTVNPESGPSTRVLSTVKAFSASRGNVVIAVKRKVVNVVYYEKYTDGKYGLFLAKDIPATLDNADRVIVEVGYGVVDTDARGQKSIKIWSTENNMQFDNIQGASSRDLFEDYEGVIYRVNQQNPSLTPLTTIDKANQVTFNETVTKSYIFPNFAKGVYQGAGGTTTQITITDGGASASPHVIRTPKQFKNINPIVTNSESKFFKQERDLDFLSKTIGGQDVFTSAIIANEFKWNYDGNIKKIRNLNISGGDSPSLFKTNSGNIENIHFVGFSIVGGTGYTALIAATNSSGATINNCLIEGYTGNGALIRGNSESYTGTVAGVNSGTISNISIVDHNTRNNISFVSRNYGSGGVVGSNKGKLEHIIYLAYAPIHIILNYPITCEIFNVTDLRNCYYKQFPYVGVAGGGVALAPNTKPNMEGSTFWVDMPAYPYNKLKDFPTPTWPVAN